MCRAARKGANIPEELGICGFGDMPFAEAMFLSLTTISVPAQSMGYHAGKMILTKLKGEKAHQKIASLSLKVIERETTRKVT